MFALRAVKTTRGDKIGFSANNRLYSLRASSLGKLENPVHISVIGNTNSGLTVFNRTGYYVRDTSRPIEQRVLGMQMEMYERRAHLSSSNIEDSLVVELTRL